MEGMKGREEVIRLFFMRFMSFMVNAWDDVRGATCGCECGVRVRSRRPGLQARRDGDLKGRPLRDHEDHSALLHVLHELHGDRLGRRAVCAVSRQPSAVSLLLDTQSTCLLLSLSYVSLRLSVLLQRSADDGLRVPL